MKLRLENITNFNLLYEDRIGYLDNYMDALGYSQLGQGRHRRSYLSPNKRFVLKFPHNREGVNANRREAERYKRVKNKPDFNNHGITYAPCRLLHGNILMMWAVKESFGYTNACVAARESGIIKNGSIDRYNLPIWASYVDSDQFGVLSNGKIVAYDYA